ncbi:MAG: hypothetical protein LH647_04480 [Leptolyngbyaceae cyanobacterium CAN_BIN12]|nr:hypothetical protein [Leptolyngbyaceae cyanobacterium CAN_BIN12]
MAHLMPHRAIVPQPAALRQQLLVGTCSAICPRSIITTVSAFAIVESQWAMT